MDISINTCMALGSNLPLIFVGGRPACLSTMTVPQLKRFIPFMMECEGFGHEIPIVYSHHSEIPCWWPLSVEYSKQIFSDPGPVHELERRLRNIVQRCYENYSLAALIGISSTMSDASSGFGFVRVEHNDNETSNLISFSDKLVSTVRTCVVKYDEETLKPDSNVIICESLYNRPILKLIKTKFPDYKYFEGKIKLPMSDLSTIPELNSQVNVRGVVFVNQNGQRVRYPFVIPSMKSVLLPEQVSHGFEENNICKIIVLSDSDKESNYENGLQSILPSSRKEVIASIVHCRYCSKGFSGNDFCQEHECYCSLGPRVPRKTEKEKKLEYLTGLGLSPVSKRGVNPQPVKNKCEIIIHSLNPTSSDPLGASQNTAKRSKKSKPKPKPKRIVTFFKTHPIPFTSSLGFDLVRNSESGGCQNSTNIDKVCPTQDPLPEVLLQTWPVTTSKKIVTSRNEYIHEYSYGRNQYRHHHSEIVLGLNSKSWSSLNKCKNAYVQIRETDRIPQKYLQPANKVVMNGPQLLNGKVRRDFDGVDTLDTIFMDAEIPVIKITDIYNVEQYAKYFQNTNSK